MLVEYPNLIAEMARRGATREDVAKASGMSRQALYTKLKGVTDFTLPEAKAIRDALASDKTLDELFQRG